MWLRSGRQRLVPNSNSSVASEQLGLNDTITPAHQTFSTGLEPPTISSTGHTRYRSSESSLSEPSPLPSPSPYSPALRPQDFIDTSDTDSDSEGLSGAAANSAMTTPVQLGSRGGEQWQTYATKLPA
jgi:hypothetical protein